MFKLIPLIFFIFFSVCLYFVVNILTGENKDLEVFSEKKINEHDLKNDVQVEIKNISELNELKESNLNQDIESIGDKKKIKQEVKREVTEKKILKKSQINKSNNNLNLENKYYTQFGAFSKKKGAELLSEKINKKLKNKYDVSRLKIIFNEENKVFKLILENSSLKIAQNVCLYSKKNDIECYVTKK